MGRQSKTRASWLMLSGLLVVLGSACVHDVEPPLQDEVLQAEEPAPAQPVVESMAPRATEMLVAPVRVHALQSDLSDALDSSLSDEEIHARFTEVNRIWEQANIRFDIESIQRPDAEQAVAFEELILSGAMKPGPLLSEIYTGSELLTDGWNVVLIEDFGNMPPGVYSCGTQVVIAARYFGPNRKEAPVTVLAHELGHSLTLPHLCGEGENLMCANGMQPEQLFASQIDAARSQLELERPAHCGD